MPRTRLATALGVVAVAWLGPLAAPASAHVTDDKEEIEAGRFGEITVTVPHGCEESPTTGLSIQMPPGFLSVSPQVKPGWEITTQTEALEEPIEGEGGPITERIGVVTFTGGPLPGEFRDTFTIGFQAPDTPGEMAYFKTVQTCEQGETAWIEEWDGTGEEPEHPAPAALLVAGSADAHGGAQETEADTGSELAATDDGGESDGGSSTTLSVIALIAGLAGLALGGAALFLARRPAEG